MKRKTNGGQCMRGNERRLNGLKPYIHSHLMIDIAFLLFRKHWRMVIYLDLTNSSPCVTNGRTVRRARRAHHTANSNNSTKKDTLKMCKLN